MTAEQIRLLAKMKKMIVEGNKKFSGRKDRDYLQDLLNIGITEQGAWQSILTLSSKDYYHDYRPFYLKNGRDALVFKKEINGYVIYIKIKLELYNNTETVTCLSFHIDHK